MKEDEPDVLTLLTRHELAIKELYEAFAATFNKNESFWRDLAANEEKHAEWLTELRSDSIAGNWLQHDSPVKPQAIKTSIGYVESQVRRAKEGNFNILQALSIARDLETALLERQFHKLKESAPKEIRSVLMNLAAETEGHRKALVEAIHTEKQRSP